MAYTPDVARENMLRNLVKQLEPLNQDLLLVTHSIPPTDLIKQFDYVLYDKENIMVPMYETENFSLYSNEFFSVQTQLNAFNLQNHGIAALKMLYLGLSMAKTLGYKTVIQIEFDTELLNTDCLQKWHKLLETYDTVVFGANHDFYDLQCNLFNLASFSYKELQYNEEEQKKYLADSNNDGMAEKVLVNHLLKYQNNGLVDRIERQRYMNTDLTWGLFSKNIHNIITPLSCNNYGNDLVYIFVLNSTNNEIMDVDIIVNKQTYHNCKVKPNEFSLVPVSDMDNIDLMQVIYKNTVWVYDFKNDDRLKHHALLKKSFIKFV